MKSALLLLFAICIGLSYIAYTSFHDNDYYKQILKDKAIENKQLQHSIDSLTTSLKGSESKAAQIKIVVKKVEKIRELSEREVDSLMDIFKPTTFDSANYKLCNSIVVAQTKELKIDNNLLTLKDSVIANTEFALGDCNSILLLKDRQISGKDEIINTQFKEINHRKKSSFMNKVVMVGEAVMIGFLMIKK